MKPATTIKTIAATWRKKIWGFYDLQFVDYDLPKEIKTRCGCGIFSCGYIGKMEIRSGSAGFCSESKYHYLCPNCFTQVDARYMMRRIKSGMQKAVKLNPDFLK